MNIITSSRISYIYIFNFDGNPCCCFSRLFQSRYHSSFRAIFNEMRPIALMPPKSRIEIDKTDGNFNVATCVYSDNMNGIIAHGGVIIIMCTLYIIYILNSTTFATHPPLCCFPFVFFCFCSNYNNKVSTNTCHFIGKFPFPKRKRVKRWLSN